MKLACFLLLTFFFFVSTASMACSGGSNAGTLSPTAAYQTQAVTNGQYYAINVTCGDTYHFTFCSDGGSAGWDTQITINQTNNTTQIAYNDDACGLQSQVSWTATFTGTIHVLISRYNCNHDGSQSGTLAYNVTSTAVAYSASCTTATANISGATGGTFAFNPAPGDGATINSGTGAISNATEGASYTVEYTYCGGTLSIPVTMGASPCYSLNGNAQYINVNGEQCIQLTAAVNDQTGCAWSDELVDFNSDFSLSLDYYFGNNPGGADGTTFTFQPSPGACGSAGAQLGAGGIPNALIVEFDTYDNDGGTNDDLNCDHIAIETDSELITDPAISPNNPPYCGPTCAISGGTSIEDGNSHDVEITWDAASQIMYVYFDGDLRLSCSGDFVNNVFGGANEVYWGATAATGGLNNQQYFCPSTVIVLPVELSLFEVSCADDRELFHWKTATEYNVDHFELEYTYDGIVFYPMRKIDAIGNSTIENSYSVSLESHEDDKRYYRLKITDKDGSVKHTDIIAGKSCGAFSNSLITSIGSAKDQLYVSLNEAGRIQLLDQLGKLIFRTSDSRQFHHVPTGNLSTGIYYLSAQSEAGKTETKKIYVQH